MPRGIAHTLDEIALTPRQEQVLRAVVTCYVGEGGAVGSATISHLLSTRLSSASIRNTLAELSELGLIEQPHTSAGRVPNERGLRVFIDRLLGQQLISEYDRRTIDFGVEEADPGSVGRVASRLLSEQTRLLGFVLTPPLDRAVLQQVSLVRVASDRILAVLVSTTGAAFRRLIRDDGHDARLDDRQLEQISALLRERVRGRTLPEVRDALAREAAGQRQRADRLLAKALELGARALSPGEDEGEDLVVATWLSLLDQPEFRDASRLRELLEAIETRERLIEVLDQMLDDPGVQVALGGELDEPALHRCALVAARFGGDAPGGAVGVIGPARMDYGRVMPLVGYLAGTLTDKLAP